MAFKTVYVSLAPDGNPRKHVSHVATGMIEVTTVIGCMADVDATIAVCVELAETRGVSAVVLCPGFTHSDVARMQVALGPKVAVDVARGDGLSSALTGRTLEEEGWIRNS